MTCKLSVEESFLGRANHMSPKKGNGKGETLACKLQKIILHDHFVSLDPHPVFEKRFFVDDFSLAIYLLSDLSFIHYTKLCSFSCMCFTYN